jgi:predicted PurR-regulated permease PerM
METKRRNEAERQFVRRVMIVLALTSLFLLAWQLRHLILMLFGAVVVATIFRSIADRIAKHTRAPHGIATALSILLVLGTVVGLIAMFGSYVGQQVQSLAEALPAAWRTFEARIAGMGLGEQLGRLTASMSSPGGASLSAFGKTIISITTGIADVIIVLVAGIFLAVQPRFYLTGLVKLFPSGKRSLAIESILESERALRLWLKGQLIAMILVGLLVGLGLAALGMPSAFTLGLLAGILEFIPFAGPIISAIPALLLALAVSPDMALYVVLLYIAVQQFEGAVLMPLVQQYAVDLPGVILLFSLIAFGAIFGVLGVVLAAPLAVVTYVLVKRLYVIETLNTPTPLPGDTKE